MPCKTRRVCRAPQHRAATEHPGLPAFTLLERPATGTLHALGLKCQQQAVELGGAIVCGPPCRVYSPSKQVTDHDPKGVFIKK